MSGKTVLVCSLLHIHQITHHKKNAHFKLKANQYGQEKVLKKRVR